MTTQTLPDQRTIGFKYDANGNVISITPPSKPSHGFTFTPGDLTSSYNPPAVPGGGSTQYSYNLDRQLTGVQRPDGQSIGLVYDGTARLTTLNMPSGAYTYGYDAATGQLTSLSAPGGVTLSYQYNGPLMSNISWSGALAGSVGYTYDNFFRVASENGIAFGFDSDGLLTSAGALQLQRDAGNGLLTGTTFGVVTDAYSYNEFGEVTGYTASVNGAAVLSEGYVRDAGGRIQQRSETMGGLTTTTTFGYDTAGRLQTVSDGTTNTQYTYDSNSNRLTKNGETGTYDDQDRLLTYAGTTYTYTANGELLSKTDGAGVTTYQYDVLGNLREVTLPDGRVIDYVIDGQNRRVGKKVNGTLVRQWLYGGQLRIVAELDGNGAVLSQFVYGSRMNVPDYMLQGGTTYRIVTDHLGSPRMVINSATGAVFETMTFDEFGNVTSDSTPGFQPFGFAGGLYNADTRLVRFGARDYDARVGRWVVKDLLGFGGGETGLYSYSSGDPINFIDPPGLASFGVAGSGSLEAGTVAPSVGATGSLGAGVFMGGGKGVSVGAFASGGAFAGGPWYGVAAPRCPSDNNWALGGFGGGGLNVFASNANEVSDLAGPFKTLSVNAGLKTRVFGLQVSIGQNTAGKTIVVVSYGGPLGVPVATGWGLGASLSYYNTNTVTTGSNAACGCH